MSAGHDPSESTALIRNRAFGWAGWGAARWQGQEGSPPAECALLEHPWSCWGCSSLVLQTSLFESDGSNFLLPSAISLPGMLCALAESLSALVAACEAVQSLAEHGSGCTLYLLCAGWTKANPKLSRCIWSSDNSSTYGKGPATRPAQFSLFNLLSTFAGLTAWVAEPPSAI